MRQVAKRATPTRAALRRSRISHETTISNASLKNPSGSWYAHGRSEFITVKREN